MDLLKSIPEGVLVWMLRIELVLMVLITISGYLLKYNTAGWAPWILAVIFNLAGIGVSYRLLKLRRKVEMSKC